MCPILVCGVALFCIYSLPYFLIVSRATAVLRTQLNKMASTTRTLLFLAAVGLALAVAHAYGTTTVRSTVIARFGSTHAFDSQLNALLGRACNVVCRICSVQSLLDAAALLVPLSTGCCAICWPHHRSGDGQVAPIPWVQPHIHGPSLPTLQVEFSLTRHRVVVGCAVFPSPSLLLETCDGRRPRWLTSSRLPSTPWLVLTPLHHHYNCAISLC